MAKEQFAPTTKDLDYIKRGLELLRTSYQRNQKQRPEFAEISKQYEADISVLLSKL